jgi:hypothetical protein
VNSRKKALPNTFFLYNMNSKPPKAMWIPTTPLTLKA